MEDNKNLLYFIIIFLFIFSSFIMYVLVNGEEEIQIFKAKDSIKDFISKNNYIDEDSLVKLDDNYYHITGDLNHLVDLNSEQLVDSKSIISNNEMFNNLLFKELRIKYPLFIVNSIINREYSSFDVSTNKIDITYNGEDGNNYSVTLICKDYKDLVNYKCLDDIEEDPNISAVDNNKVVALTFDDGPCTYTEGVIQELLNFNMKATFFELGSLMEKYPEIVKKVKDSGFEIGSHGYNHRSFVKLKLAGTLQDIARTNEIYKSITGEDLKLVRPPYGAINNTIRNGANTTFVKWSVDSLDWKVKDERYVENIMSVVKDGDIILVHDIQKTTLDHLNSLLTRLYNEGFRVVTVSELAQIKGVNMELNKTYFHFRNS